MFIVVSDAFDVEEEGIVADDVDFCGGEGAVIGVGINTFSSPGIPNFETSSLQKYTKKRINNNQILKDIKKTYELFVKDIGKYGFTYLKRKYK